MDLAIRIILCVIFPPLAVFDKGLGAILLVLLLTFLGWILLGMVTWGIPMIWVNPYMQLTMAGFYRALGGDNIAFPHKPQPEEPETRDDLKDAFTTSAYRDQEDK